MKKRLSAFVVTLCTLAICIPSISVNIKDLSSKTAVESIEAKNVSVETSKKLRESNSFKNSGGYKSQVYAKSDHRSVEGLDCDLSYPVINNQNTEIEQAVNDRIKKDVDSFYDKNKKSADKESLYLKESDSKYEAKTSFEVKKNTKYVLSMIIEYYSYTGGAHGYYEDKAYNIDMYSGDILNLCDLFEDNQDYKELINKEIKEQIDYIGKNDGGSEVFQFKSISRNQKFYIENGNLVVYFDLYDIAPYAAGIPTFTINSDKILPMVKDKYVELFT
ncbi:MAG: DUF3298 and DUF4163 domain-containing protein [Clostridioides sp.]|jgi:hypothetical protein|nr:DUF3298 and DUF4163 domain-containing protein [Clostridioides sp.]